jgi:hypothetical protein
MTRLFQTPIPTIKVGYTFGSGSAAVKALAADMNSVISQLNNLDVDLVAGDTGGGGVSSNPISFTGDGSGLSIVLQDGAVVAGNLFASGLTAIDNSYFNGQPGLTTLDFGPVVIYYGNVQLSDNNLAGSPTLTTLNMHNVVALFGNPDQARDNNVSFSPTLNALTSVDFSSVAYMAGFNLHSTSLATLNFPAIVDIGPGGFFVSACPALVTFSMGTTLKSVDPDNGGFTLTGAALNQASVDGILVRLAALDGTNGTTIFQNVTVDLSGGTSSAPSATGTAAKAVLVGRGCTVTTN